MFSKEQLREVLAQGGACCAEAQAELEAVCEEYPYFHAAQLYRAALAIKKTENVEPVVNAVLVADRLLLYSAVYGAPCGYEDFALGRQEMEHPGADGPTEAAEIQVAAAQRVEAATQTLAHGVEAQADVGPVEPTRSDAEAVSTQECQAPAARDGVGDERVGEVDAARESPLDGVAENELAGGEDWGKSVTIVAVQGEEQPEGAAVVPEGEAEPLADGGAAKGETMAAVEDGGTDVEEPRDADAQREGLQEIPTIDLHGVLEQALSQAVPDMSPSLSPFGTVGFSLSQRDIDYINAHLNPRGSRDAGRDGGVDAEGATLSQAQRIDSFIENFDSILSKVLEEERADAAQGQVPDDLAESQGQLDAHIASERLAYLLAEKGEYDVAMQMYERLGAQNPEKSSYFAEVIARLRARKEETK